MIDEGESLVRLAHIDQAHPEGSVIWAYAYVHVTACATPRPAAHERPTPARGTAPAASAASAPAERQRTGRPATAGAQVLTGEL